MQRKTRLTTLSEQQRRQHSAAEGGKKLAGGCLIGAALFLFAYCGESSALFSLAVGAAALGAAVLSRLHQVPLSPLSRTALTLLCGAVGLYFAARGVLALLLSAAGGAIL